jgi:hypothetical protein
MAARRSFKSDVSFLEKLSMGAIGTHKVFENLSTQGHHPIELERGSMSFKIWKEIKIKRIRVPDILCVDCARRIESRAKTSLEISMSHSFSDPERGWDYGLDDQDYVALVVCRKIGEKPIEWQAADPIQYISVHSLREAYRNELVISVTPKGAEEGFEARITWPAAVAKAAGVAASVTRERIQYRRGADNRVISLSLLKQGLRLTPLVQEGDPLVENQVLAAVVPIVREFLCPGNITHTHYVERLASSSLSERYASAKALSVYPANDDIDQALSNKLADSDEHIYVKLEAAASLARHGNGQGWSFIEQCLADEYLQNRLEAVIILGEISATRSSEILSRVLMDRDQNPEIRAGAAWALGELHDRSAIDTLIQSFVSVNQGIRAEAARALAKLAEEFSPEILRRFPQSRPPERPGISWALSRSGRFQLQDVLDLLVDDDARQWAAFLLGTQDQQKFVHEIERLRNRDPEVYFAVTVLWKILTSWIYGLEEY